MRRPKAVLFLAVVVVAALAGAVPGAAKPAPAGPIAVTDRGLVRGAVDDGVRRFQGIPYAAAPVGELRWRSPRPARPWPGVYDATRPRSQCAQPASPVGGVPSYVEDCLYLNVTTPKRPRRPLPVMVWLHGGSNVSGAGHIYDAGTLASQGDVVVVTVNYRLGVFGWLAHPAFESGADRARQAGNYGLLDQQAALRWVRHNAVFFGGDPRNVTLFGESAGALDSCAHLVSPAAAGLFHKAIPQSYSCTDPFRTEEAAQAEAARFATALGCAGEPGAADCLRDLPARTLVDRFQSAGMSAVPVAGGDDLLPRQPREAIERGQIHRVPVMHGNTLDEMRLFIPLQFPEPISAEQYAAVVREDFGAAAEEVLARYPAEAYPSPRIALATVYSDNGTPLSTCQHLDAYRALAAAGVPVHAYQFADRTASPLVDVPGYEEGAEHGTELNYLWPNLLGPLDGAQRRLSDAMVGYWTSFAHTGTPAAPGAPDWPRFRDSGDVLSLDIGSGGIRPTDVARQSHCAFWADLNRTESSTFG
ncbi:para-nitrobenzyl esterase [Amycolatopsis arida]|uniref:Carboxylic ester hydrolase n=1 Tax=Amycolatopsis arida TaxID=587909 RepID=A0A1I6AK08_9PSEU|nr:carboxylesterase family protein [Amycolatopsis arida]TDX87333.1 para-nitrobenzyl esterase [Amycolatopsis arida]SFQ68983.1 para-nitrobenzyl esterase [Amycolatopsis arida]